MFGYWMNQRFVMFTTLLVLSASGLAWHLGMDSLARSEIPILCSPCVGMASPDPNMGQAVHPAPGHETLYEKVESFVHVLRSQSDDSVLSLARRLRDQGKSEGAIEHLRTALLDRPDVVPWLNELGTILISTAQYHEAANRLTRSIELNPNRARTHYNLGVALSRLGRSGEALASYQRAIAQNPAHTRSFYNTGIIQLKRGNVPEAKAAFLRALEAHSPSMNPKIHYQLGQIYARQGEVDNARRSYRQAVRLRPDYIAARVGLARLSEKKGDVEAAVTEWQRVVRLNPQSDTAQYSLGRIYERLNDPIRAIEAYKKNLKLQPGHVESLMRIGRIYLMLGRPCEARVYFERVLKLNPHHQEAMNELRKVVIE